MLPPPPSLPCARLNKTFNMTIKMNTFKDTHYGFFSSRSLPPVATAKNAENNAKTTTDHHVRLSVLNVTVFLPPSPPSLPSPHIRF